MQEAMLRASRALLRDEREIDLKPWLFRLTRNCALDELSRVKGDSVALDDEDSHIFLAAPAASEPEPAHERRAGVRELLEDIATLPEVQRHALLRRELDGQSHEQIARELGLSEGSTKSLVFRARANLVREREARTEDCADVRMQLHRGRRRAPPREAADAAPRRQVPGLPRVPPRAEGHEPARSRSSTRASCSIGLGVGGGALKWLDGKGAAAKADRRRDRRRRPRSASSCSGRRSSAPAIPRRSRSRAPPCPSGQLAAQQPIPAGTAIVRQTAAICGRQRPRASRPSSPARRACASPTCCRPTGAKLRVAYARSTVVGAEPRRARQPDRPGARAADDA